MIFDGTLAALGNTILPLATTADCDTGYHENEMETHIDNALDDLDAMDFASEVEVNSTQHPESGPSQLPSESVSRQQVQNDCSRESATLENTDPSTQQSMFKTGNKRRRPALKSTYDSLHTITSKKIDQLNRSENNEDELMEIKRKRFKLEESMAHKNEELIDAQIRYFEAKNRREEEIHERQLQMFGRTMENTK